MFIAESTRDLSSVPWSLRLDPPGSVEYRFQRVRCFADARFGSLLVLSLSACAARYQLLDADLDEARGQGSLEALRVYPSHRTISVYDEPDTRMVTVDREIRQRSTKERRKRILTIDTPGAIVAEAELNGAKLLWVTFDRTCTTPECAYGFVQTEDGRYRLVHVPEREGFAAPVVHRGWVGKRRKMTRGNLYQLAEANTVYRTKRKKRVRTVFLEVKKDIRKRVRGQSTREPGVQ